MLSRPPTAGAHAQPLQAPWPDHDCEATRGAQGPRGLLPRLGMSRLSLFWCVGLFCPPSRNPRPAGFCFLPYRQLVSTTWHRRVASIPQTICTPATWLGPRSVAQDWEGRLSYLPQTNIDLYTRHLAGPQVCRPGLGREAFLITTNQYQA